jgi:predicted lipoprotein with Yx(FWY)xxD motif
MTDRHLLHRLAVVSAAAAISLAALAGCSTAASPGSDSAASTAPSPTATTPAELTTATTSLGTVLVDAQGRTLYVFDKDTAGSPSVCAGACAALWPAALTTAASPTVSGVSGTVGTVATADGQKQLTLNGLPLYTYSKDAAAGDVTGQAFGGIWWVVGANGAKITATAAPTPASTPANDHGGNSGNDSSSDAGKGGSDY